jgi:hypothetical protein
MDFLVTEVQKMLKNKIKTFISILKVEMIHLHTTKFNRFNIKNKIINKGRKSMTHKEKKNKVAS